MNHRQDVHPEKRRRCRNDIKGNCDFTSDTGLRGCWWRHGVTSNDNTLTIKNEICNICDVRFKTRSELMIHKLDQHEDTVPFCTKQKEGVYDFQKCWFRHKSISNPNENIESPESDNQGFWEYPTPTQPPGLVELKEILLKAMEMITSVNKKLEESKN